MTPTGHWRFSILRVYWDGETTPSIEVPVGDFFASGWGRYGQINSLAVAVNPGSAFNCYWVMPFRKSCRITMENIADQEMTLYYQIDYTLTEVAEDAAYLHAQFRRVNPLPYKQDYTIVDGVKGEGQFVGTHMSWGVNNTGWWGEGEIKFFLDGDTDYPTICGTGTEDYFCGSYNFENQTTKQYQEFSTPYSGMPLVDPARWRLPVAAALRPVPLAHHGPHPIRAGSAGDDPGAGLAHRRPLPAAAGRHRVGGLLVSGRTARGVSGVAGERRAGDHLNADTVTKARRTRGRTTSPREGSPDDRIDFQSAASAGRASWPLQGPVPGCGDRFEQSKIFVSAIVAGTYVVTSA